MWLCFPSDIGLFARIQLSRLAQYPDYQLPQWIHRTLAHWLPELGEPSPPDPSLQNRYSEAAVAMIRQFGAYGESIFIDDLQYMDETSAQMGEYLLSSLFPLGRPGTVPGMVTCYRKGEASPAIEQSYVELAASGIAVRIELEPLPPLKPSGECWKGLGWRTWST